jgi:hypothetical protein
VYTDKDKLLEFCVICFLGKWNSRELGPLCFLVCVFKESTSHISLFLFLVVLGFKLRVLCLLSMHYTTEPQLLFYYLFIYSFILSFIHLFIYFCFGTTGLETGNLVLARQVLYHLRHRPSPFMIYLFFSNRISWVCLVLT